MPTPIIRVEGLGKKYLLRHQAGGPRYRALRDVLTDGFKTGFGLLRRAGNTPTREEFWALKDVNFEVNEGEVVGIIGRNGAGKSTLLKILSRITEPTTGRVTLDGRVASLLEVGTGFHPELTGRENIYLNGSILGMSRAEISRKFDEIVAFADVEKFLDTPVKRYSSGMYVRLAFAVAAHLEPEILVVDEVLAVGDAEFQKKCLGKMSEVARGGRTVLVVSHQLPLVQSIATTALLLDQGHTLDFGPTARVVRRYLGTDRSTTDLARFEQRGSGEAAFARLRMTENGTAVGDSLSRGLVLGLGFDLNVRELIADANVSVSVRNAEGVELFSDSWCDQEDSFLTLTPGEHRFVVDVPTAILRPGVYSATLCLVRRSGYVVALVSGIDLPAVVLGESRVHNLEGNRWGVVYQSCRWRKE